MHVRCGTSGFSYPTWKGSFYPAGAKPAEMLGLYAARLPAVEINATFYRMPTANLLAGWRERVPAGFAFALKGPQRITHVKRLVGAAGDTARFHEVAAELGSSLGPILWQLPPSLKKDLPRLREFLALLPRGSCPAIEFRHESWWSDDVLALLHEHGAALVTVDAEQGDTPLVPTARTGYLRLRAPDYGVADLRRWAERILGQPWDQAWVFFKHEDAGKGPAFALALADALGESAVRTAGGA